MYIREKTCYNLPPDEFYKNDFCEVYRCLLYTSEEGANLEGAYLRGANLEGAYLDVYKRQQIFNVEGHGSNDAKILGLSLYGTSKRAVTYFTEALALSLIHICKLKKK